MISLLYVRNRINERKTIRDKANSIASLLGSAVLEGISDYLAVAIARYTLRNKQTSLSRELTYDVFTQQIPSTGDFVE